MTQRLIRWVTLPNGVTLPFVEQGDSAGVPVVLLHAVADSWRSFDLAGFIGEALSRREGPQ